MLNRTSSFLFVFLFGAGLFIASAGAQDRSAEVRAMLEQRDREIKQVLGKKDIFTEPQLEKLKTLINGNIDFAVMGAEALGPFWKDLTAEQRAEFVDVFSEIVRAQSLSDLDIYRTNVTYEKVTAAGDTARVLTSTVYKEVPAKVEYALGFHDNQWWLHDIILDDVSTTEGYARSFQSVVRKRGFEALMNNLRKKRDKVVTSN